MNLIAYICLHTEVHSLQPPHPTILGILFLSFVNTVTKKKIINLHGTYLSLYFTHCTLRLYPTEFQFILFLSFFRLLLLWMVLQSFLFSVRKLWLIRLNVFLFHKCLFSYQRSCYCRSLYPSFVENSGCVWMWSNMKVELTFMQQDEYNSSVNCVLWVAFKKKKKLSSLIPELLSISN